jgi:CHAT domain-containing protein
MEETCRNTCRALSLAVLVGATLAVALLGRHDGRPLRERLLAAGKTRPTPGRLAREVAYRLWSAPKLYAGLDAYAAAALAHAEAGPMTQLDRATLDLFMRNYGRAIAGFELAARDPSSGAEALADLSAAYLARYDAERNCLDLLRAVQAADRGLALERTGGALLFNRATALSLLGTRLLARRAWIEFRQTGETGWSDEASLRLRAAGQRSVEQEWALTLPRLDSPRTSLAEVETLTARFPFQARLFAEEVLLPRWAAAISAGDVPAATRSLQIASAIGAMLRRLRGEELLADAVAAIQRVLNKGSAVQREALLRGLRGFGVGVAHYNNQNIDSAEKALRPCETDLALADNPLRYWARFYLAVGQYYKDADGALVTLDTLLEEIPAQRYPALVGRIEWIAGTIDKVQGRIQSSVQRTERAEASLRRSGGAPAAAFISVLLAEAYAAIGEHAMAWEKRRLAFEQVPASDGPRRCIAMWTEAKEALVRQESLALAGPFVDEAVENAERWGKPLGQAAACVDRAAYRASVGDRDAALIDLRRAHAAIARMEPSGMRDQSAYLALIAEGLCYRRTDPARAAQLLQEALSRQAATGTRFHAISYTTTLALAQIASGDTASGKASLERALSLFENIRATVEDPVSRMQAFRQAQSAFDRLIDLESASAGDHEKAFALAERSRARVLLELRTGGRAVEFVRLADVERDLPSAVTFVSYVVLDERILAWVVEDGKTRAIAFQARRDEVEQAIERFRLELKRGADVAGIRAAAMPLYDMLIRPLSLSPCSGCGLIIIPDRFLARLPFPALVDRASGQYLVEQRAVSIAPSATLLLRSARRSGPPPSQESVLAVGVSCSGVHQGVDLPPLPNADDEAARVGALYPTAATLRGARATRENFVRLSLSANVIHFAGHAVVDLEAPRRSVLLFADRTGHSLEPLTLEELLKAGFADTRLVVLSACRAQDSLADDREGLLGLAGAFVAGGAQEVVASPLDVADDSSGRVMVAFHRHYRRLHSAPAAFREAILDLLRSGNSGAASPAAWAGFTVIKGSL